MTKQIYYILSFILLISTNSVAQSNNLWLRTTFSIKDSLGITYDTELQYRLQNSNENIFPNKNILNSARIWMHYVSNEKLKISFSPIAIFDHIQYKNDDQPSEKYHLTEYRNSLATEYKLVEKEIVDFYVRTAVEGRIFTGNNAKFRWRNRVGMDIKLSSKTIVKQFYELFHQSENKTPLQFDQMRFNVSIIHQLKENLGIELGAIYLLKPDQTKLILDEEYNYYMNLNYKF